MFLLLGAIYAVLGLISVVMIGEPTESTSLEYLIPISEKAVNLRPTEVLRTITFYQVMLSINNKCISLSQCLIH